MRRLAPEKFGDFEGGRLIAARCAVVALTSYRPLWAVAITL